MTTFYLLASIPAADILIYVFIGIFVLTAIITLASLPNWIKLDEWYKKKLFLALILEVVGIIVVAGGNALGVKTASSYELVDTDWVALDKYGNLIQPKVKSRIADEETDSIDKRLGLAQFNTLPTLYLDLNFDNPAEVQLLVKTNDKQNAIGQLSSDGLKKIGLFNLINDVESQHSYATIRFEKKNGKWVCLKDATINDVTYSDFLDDEVRFGIDYNSELNTHYVIYNTTDTVYRSKNREFNTKYRKIHFCKNSDNKYFLFRIVSANLQNEPLFVNVLQMKIEPEVSFAKK